MTDWGAFPTRTIDATVALYRIHQHHRQPAWFNTDGSWRFDPLPSHRQRFGVCYLGLEPLASYVEVFGRIRAVPQVEFERRRLSEFTVATRVEVADLTDRSVLGDYGVTAAHSAGTDYHPAQELATHLFDGGHDGVLYRIRHDPAMALEAVALFGDPGVTPERLSTPKTTLIPPDIVAAGRQFHIEVLPSAPLP